MSYFILFFLVLCLFIILFSSLFIVVFLFLFFFLSIVFLFIGLKAHVFGLKTRPRSAQDDAHRSRPKGPGRNRPSCHTRGRPRHAGLLAWPASSPLAVWCAQASRLLSSPARSKCQLAWLASFLPFPCAAKASPPLLCPKSVSACLPRGPAAWSSFPPAWCSARQLAIFFSFSPTWRNGQPASPFFCFCRATWTTQAQACLLSFLPRLPQAQACHSLFLPGLFPFHASVEVAKQRELLPVSTPKSPTMLTFIPSLTLRPRCAECHAPTARPQFMPYRPCEWPFGQSPTHVKSSRKKGTKNSAFTLPQDYKMREMSHGKGLEKLWRRREGRPFWCKRKEKKHRSKRNRERELESEKKERKREWRRI